MYREQLSIMNPVVTWTDNAKKASIGLNFGSARTVASNITAAQQPPLESRYSLLYNSNSRDFYI